MTNGYIPENMQNGYGSKEILTNGHGPKETMTNGHGPKDRSRSKTKTNVTNDANTYNVDISQEIAKTVHSLKTDLDRLSNRINSLEKNSSKMAVTKHTRRISFANISPSFLAFLIIWPFVTHSVLRYLSNRK